MRGSKTAHGLPHERLFVLDAVRLVEHDVAPVGDGERGVYREWEIERRRQGVRGREQSIAQAGNTVLSMDKNRVGVDALCPGSSFEGV